MGLLLRLTKGSNDAAKTPRTIVIRYLGYLRTLAKNSPINHLTKEFNGYFPSPLKKDKF